MGSTGGFYFSRSDRKISTLKESCVACRCWPQIAGIQQFVGSAGFASLYTHSVDDGAYYDRCRCWTLKYGTGILCCVVSKANEGSPSDSGLWAVEGVCR